MFCRLLLVCLLSSLTICVANAAGDEKVAQLEALFAKQQKQIDAQSKEIAAMKAQLQHDAKRSLVSSKLISHHQKKTIDNYPKVFHTNDKVHLKLYGQLNQAVMLVDDGIDNNLFFVTTNDNQISRFGLLAETFPKEDLTVGGRIELGLRVNRSNEVSQADESPSSRLDFRRLEVYLDSKNYGALHLGKGSMASDKTAKRDLSGTKIVANANVAKLGGGVIFRQRGQSLAAAEATNPTVGDAFNLIIDSRVRTASDMIHLTSMVFV